MQKDFYAWAFRNAALIRQGNFSAVDCEEVAEELESLGLKERRVLYKHYLGLLCQLIKWTLLPNFHNRVWQDTIKIQRVKIKELLEENPSLQAYLETNMAPAYQRAIKKIIQETGLSENMFFECSFTFTQSLEQDYFPD